jgi:hypothetical protein
MVEQRFCYWREEPIWCKSLSSCHLVVNEVLDCSRSLSSIGFCKE